MIVNRYARTVRFFGISLLAGSVVGGPALASAHVSVKPARNHQGHVVPLVNSAAPAVSSSHNRRIDLFARNGDGRLRYQFLDKGRLASWSSPGLFGGRVTSAPSVVSSGDGQLHVFVRDADDQLMHRRYANGVWSGWESLGARITSAPAAVSWRAGGIEVFARGADHSLLHRTNTGGHWSGWRSLGGHLGSGPAVASWGPGRIDVFVRTPDGVLRHRWRSDGRWSAWRSLGTGFTAKPAAASPETGHIEVFARRDDATLSTRRYGPNGWSPWSSLGGRLSAGPGAASPAPNEVAVFTRTSAGGYTYRTRHQNGSWSGWQPVDSVKPFRGLGAWVDTYDVATIHNPSPHVAAMASHGVHTLYLGTSRSGLDQDLAHPRRIEQWLEAAHKAGIRAVGWYVPDYAHQERDLRRTLAIARHTTPSGQRFDAVGIDIEYRPNHMNMDTWNQRITQHLARVDAATSRPIGAIVLPPLDMDRHPQLWADFPWSAVSQHADVVLPMSYWTLGTPAALCPAHPRFCPSGYTIGNTQRAHELTGLPVHTIGGVADEATDTEVDAYVAATGNAHSVGGSIYDYLTTKPNFWNHLHRLGA